VFSRNVVLSLVVLVLILTACEFAAPEASPTGAALVPTRIVTNTATATNTPTATQTPTNTPTNTLTPSNTPTNTPTLTPSNTPTDTPTFTPSFTPTPPIASFSIGEELNFLANSSIDNVNWRIHYEFTAKANDVVTIEMMTDSRAFDPFLALQDESGERLIENDDARDDTDNAAIRDFEIPQDGTYTIVATRRGGIDSPYVGEFRISFQRVPGILRGFVPISIDTTKTSTITDEQFFIGYVFQGAAGDAINIEMLAISGDLDSYLVLVNFETQEIVAENDDDPQDDTFNATMDSVILPANGLYIILATRYQGEDGLSTGDFSIRLTIED
jgi:pre-peptidase